jgi:hypothetical protein
MVGKKCQMITGKKERKNGNKQHQTKNWNQIILW